METSWNSVRHTYRWEPGNKRLVQLGSKVRTRCPIFHLRWLHHRFWIGKLWIAMVSWSFWQVSQYVFDFLRRPCRADPRIAVRWSPWALCQRTLPIWTWRRAWKWIWLYQVEVHHVAKSCAKKTKLGKSYAKVWVCAGEVRKSPQQKVVLSDHLPIAFTVRWVALLVVISDGWVGPNGRGIGRLDSCCIWFSRCFQMLKEDGERQHQFFCAQLGSTHHRTALFLCCT